MGRLAAREGPPRASEPNQTMLFDTPVYVLFLSIVVVIYWRLNRRQQNLFLLAASYMFYGWWDWRFLLLMIGSTTIDYFVARAISTSNNPRRRKALLIFSLVLNFSVLAFFKYLHFFADSFARTLRLLGAGPLTIPFFEIILPPGISFYTFQEVAYIVDVYRNRLPASRSFVDYALFISLFPHLIAGPIQRPSHLLPQVQVPRRFDPEMFFDGLMLIASGFFRKTVLADQSALLANAAFDGQLGHNLFATFLGAAAFAIQIYADFSAYSDFARGSAQLLGFHFMINFRQPYLAVSLQDFWRRWHISLSTWLRDYLYIPLGGNRHGPVATYRNLIVTMLLGGLWHGANWTFVVWGGIHGCGLALERLFSREPASEPGVRFLWARRIVTFAIVCLSWIFFRAGSLRQAVGMIGDLARLEWRPQFAVAAAMTSVLASIALLIDLRMETAGEEYIFQKLHSGWRVAVGATLVSLVFAFSASQSNAFIYFQF